MRDRFERRVLVGGAIKALPPAIWLGGGQVRVQDVVPLRRRIRVKRGGHADEDAIVRCGDRLLPIAHDDVVHA